MFRICYGVLHQSQVNSNSIRNCSDEEFSCKQFKYHCLVSKIVLEYVGVMDTTQTWQTLNSCDIFFSCHISPKSNWILNFNDTIFVNSGDILLLLLLKNIKIKTEVVEILIFRLTINYKTFCDKCLNVRFLHLPFHLEIVQSIWVCTQTRPYILI